MDKAKVIIVLLVVLIVLCVWIVVEIRQGCDKGLERPWPYEHFKKGDYGDGYYESKKIYDRLPEELRTSPYACLLFESIYVDEQRQTEVMTRLRSVEDQLKAIDEKIGN